MVVIPHNRDDLSYGRVRDENRRNPVVDEPARDLLGRVSTSINHNLTPPKPVHYISSLAERQGVQCQERRISLPPNPRFCRGDVLIESLRGPWLLGIQSTRSCD